MLCLPKETSAGLRTEEKMQDGKYLKQYVQIWFRDIAPDKLAKSTLARDKQDIDRFLPYLGSYKLVDLRSEHFRKLYAELGNRQVRILECRSPSTR